MLFARKMDIWLLIARRSSTRCVAGIAALGDGEETGGGEVGTGEIGWCSRALAGVL